jgi:hypothetical protein
LFLRSAVTSKLEQGADQPEKADRLRKDDQICGANRYGGRGGSPRYSKPRGCFLKLIEFTKRKVLAEAAGSGTELCWSRLAASLHLQLLGRATWQTHLSIARSIECRDVRTMKFRREAIFYDRVLLALCVGTAIFGLVALILLE